MCALLLCTPLCYLGTVHPPTASCVAISCNMTPILVTGVFVHSIATGEGSFADTESTYFGNVNEQARSPLHLHHLHCNLSTVHDGLAPTHQALHNAQVARVCDMLAGMPELRGGYNAVGFSQGAPFFLPSFFMSHPCHSLHAVHTRREAVDI